jgi:hypothetical protein
MGNEGLVPNELGAKNGLFIAFAEIDDLFEPFEDALYGLVADIDYEINLGVDAMRENCVPSSPVSPALSVPL